MNQPQGQLELLTKLLKDNMELIWINQQSIGDRIAESDMAGLHDLIKHCQDESRSKPDLQEAQEAVSLLYNMLFYLTASSTNLSPKLTEYLCQLQIVALISQHIAHLQTSYRNDLVYKLISSYRIFCIHHTV